MSTPENPRGTAAFVRRALPLACLASTLLAPGLRLAAQVPASEEIQKLNPFVLQESQDESFRAMSVGSGSRLRLDLKDAPVAYSVINREFIDALGITDLAEAASWATGQTFYNTDNGGDAFGRPSQYFSRGNLTAQGGADSFGAQRNFYQNSNNGGDSYAVESYDFGRGPNAALFGQGSATSGGDAGNGGLGGVSSMQTKRARFDNSRTSVALEIGSWNYRRATIDINRPLNERIGIRINAQDTDREAWRQRDMQASRGLTLTTTWRATDRTEVRAEVSYDRNQNHNTGAGWDEQLTGWDGKTVFRGPTTPGMRSGNAVPGDNNIANASYGTLQVLGLGQANPSFPVPQSSSAGLTFGGETNGVKFLTGNTYLYDPYRQTIMNYNGAGLSRRADGTTRVPLWTTTSPNGAFFVRGSQGSPTPASYSVGRTFHVKDGLPRDLFQRAMDNSKFRIPSERWTATIDKPSTSQRNKDFNMSITQSWGNFAFELGGDINEAVNETNSFDNPNGNNGIGGGRTAVLDLNMLRPDGTPNPGFLDIVNTFGMGWDYRTTQDSTIRFNMGYTHDFGRIGNYVFNLQGSRSERKFQSRDTELSMKLNADSRRWQNDTVSMINWWSDQVRAYKEPTNGTAVTFTDVDWSDPEAPVILAPRTIFPDYVLGNYSDSQTITKYVLGQTTARWFNNKVIFTGALRIDSSTGKTLRAVAQGDRPVGWNGEILYRPDAPSDYFTMTYIERNNTTGLPISGKPRLSGNRPRTTDPVTGLSIRNPLYLDDRFRDDFNGPVNRSSGRQTRSTGLVWHATSFLSPYINYSNTYTPQNENSLDLTGEVREPTKAYGYDFGANVNILNDRVSAKFNYYRQVRENDSFNPAPAGNINALYQSNAFDDPDTTSTGRNARGEPDLPGSDYQDRRNQGYEIELSVERLVPGLRLTANGSYGWFSTENRGRMIRDYVPANADLFRQILEDAGGLLDTTQHQVAGGVEIDSPGLAVINPAITPGIDTTNAVNSYNNLWINFATLDAGRVVRTPTQPQMNIVADYTLQRGRLRGLGMSAGFQWQGRVIMANEGNRTIINPNNPLVALDDPSRSNFDYRYMKGSFNTQLNFRYTYRMSSGNSLAFALRVNNPINDRRIVVGDGGLGGGTGFGGTYRQPEGDLTKPNRVSLPDLTARFTEPVNFRLTTTYSFGGGPTRSQ